MTAADNPPNQNHIPTKNKIQHTKQLLCSGMPTNHFLLVKLTPILQICSKENLLITTVTITSLTTE
jgi:hypothetical protein